MSKKQRLAGSKFLLAITMAVAFLFTQVLVTYSGSIVIEKKNITLTAATKGATIKTGENVVISGQGLGTTGKVFSIGIIPAGTPIDNSDEMYDKLKMIYGSDSNYNNYDIKTGKFSITTRFACTYEASPIPKGNYNLVVWWAPQGVGFDGEKMAVSTKPFSTAGDGTMIIFGESAMAAMPQEEKKESNWKYIFEPSAVVKIQSGDYIKFENVPADTTLLAGAKASIQSGKSTLAGKVSLESSKTVKGKKDLLIKFSGTVTLAAKTRATLLIERVKNPAAGHSSGFCGLYSKAGKLTAYGSGSIFISPPAPEIKMPKSVPQTLTFKAAGRSLQTEPFSITVEYDAKGQAPGKIQMRLVDAEGNFIMSSDLAFYKKISETSYSYSDAVQADIVNGKAVFNDLVLSVDGELKFDTVYLRFSDMINFEAEPVVTKAIKLEVSK